MGLTGLFALLSCIVSLKHNGAQSFFISVTEVAKLCSKLQDDGSKTLVCSLYKTPLGEKNLPAA